MTSMLKKFEFLHPSIKKTCMLLSSHTLAHSPTQLKTFIKWMVNSSSQWEHLCMWVMRKFNKQQNHEQLSVMLWQSDIYFLVYLCDVWWPGKIIHIIIFFLFSLLMMMMWWCTLEKEIPIDQNFHTEFPLK